MLTRKQRDLLYIIKEALQENGIPPSFDEMKDKLDLRSKSGIHRLIEALEERGFIRRLPNRARAIEILKMPDDVPAANVLSLEAIREKVGMPRATPANASVELPMMGRIAAGVPIAAIQMEGRTVSVPSSLVGVGEHYTLEVKGDSMIEAGIMDGDIIILRRQVTADNGDIVVALVEDEEATLKVFRRRGETVHLQAANPAYATRILNDYQVKVQGRLVGLMRSFH
jgi:repressor LexA